MRCCKHILFIILSMTLVLCTMTYSNPTYNNDLMKDASPNTSALLFYVYDGEKVSRSMLFKDKTEHVLNTFNAIKVKEVNHWSLEKITLPIYGIQIGSTDGTGILAAWSNGYWIAQNGTVYSFDFDFAKLEHEYFWDNLDEFSSICALPCSRLLTQDESGWNSKLLTPTVVLNPPEGISMTLENWDKETVTVSFINNSNSEWNYGDFYSIQVLLDDIWYEIPTIPGNWCFSTINYNLPQGQKKTKTYNLTMYGDLPEGTYRLVAQGLFVERTMS